MHGTSHLLISSSIGVLIAAALFMRQPSIFTVMSCALFIFFCSVGSIAPDIDSRRAIIKSWHFFGFWRLYWLFGYAPLAMIFGKGHRGVMHSLYGLCWSMIVVYHFTWLFTTQDVAGVATLGFFVGYLLHLIEDHLFTKTPIRWLMH
jgi:membrane-bound metal-dependent hydrolase YbcI (DUF457 family)